jgi:2-amino-4-hydroxy-6-hydroxymethyldihydropteridine diphosphokinase
LSGLASRHLAAVSLGSNVDRERMLPEAVRRLAARSRVLAVSSVWESAAVGPAQRPRFFNAALLLATSLPPERLKRDLLRAVETELGRVRTGDRFAPRRIDLDLVLYDELRCRLPDGSELPDPDLDRYLHLALPIAELLPEGRHPVTGERYTEVAARLCAIAESPPVRLEELDLRAAAAQPRRAGAPG